MSEVEIDLPVCAVPTIRYPNGRTGSSMGVQQHYRVKDPLCAACREWQREHGRRPERSAERKKYYGRNPEYFSSKNLFYKHGIVQEQYQAMLDEQGGVCAICKGSDPYGHGRFHIDHDHGCCPGARSCGKCVRALLCGRCNPGLGAFGDDPELLEAAARYIREYRAKVAEDGA